MANVDGSGGSSATDPIAEATRRAQEIAAKFAAGAAFSNNTGGDDPSRKRPLDETSAGFDAPAIKKPTLKQEVPAQAIAQAAISKMANQLGLTQMITIEIKVPNRMVGLVIGRQGEMINRLQADSAARIQVAPDGSEVNGERQVSIYGTPDAVEKAKALVNKVIEDSGGATSLSNDAAFGAASATMTPWTTYPTSVDPGQEVVELMIPANKVGLIIGKGGEMIKMLQERAGCKMQMIQDGPYASTPEKPLRMTGFPENCKRARQQVLELIEQKELEARGLIGADYTKGLPDTIEMQVPKVLVGFVIGRNGEHINNIQNTCGVRLQFQNDIPGTEFRLTTISGPPENCMRAKEMVEAIVAERQQGGVKPRLELPNPTGPGVNTVQIPVPAAKCGLVIGKGGETVRQLQMQSGAHIELCRTMQPNPHEKFFNVRGNPQQIHIATQLIRQKCEMTGPPDGGPGGYAPPGMYPQPGYPQPGQPPQPAPGPGPPGAAGGMWAQYAGYGAAGAMPNPQPGQPQQMPPDQQAAAQAWTNYYQSLYAAQAQQQAQHAQPGPPQAIPQQQPPPQQQPQQQPAPAGQPPPAGGQPAAAAATQDLSAQWAEYYRQLGYYYQQQQPGAVPGSGPLPGGDPK